VTVGDEWCDLQGVVLHVGLRVRVMDHHRLQESLDEATWATKSCFSEVMGLNGKDAIVVCDKEAKCLGRVGIRTDEGYEDAVPLAALVPIPKEEGKDKGKQSPSNTRGNQV